MLTIHNKRLLLIRHAKSSWDNPNIDDHDRPLNKRGIRDAATMSTRLVQNNENIGVVFSSTATRALEISQPISQALNVPLLVNHDLYTFSASQLLEQLRQLPEKYQSVGIVSHNPAITVVANTLLKDQFDNIPTSGVVAMNCNINTWDQLDTDHCQLDYFDYPKRIIKD